MSSNKSSANSDRLVEAVEGRGGGFIVDDSDEQSLQRALESATVVKEAIQNFPTTDEELAGSKVEAFNDAQTFLDVWTMEKNAKHRPVFLSAVADAKTLDLLLSYVRPDGVTGTARPSYLITNALGVLNRLFRDAVVARSVAQERIHQVLKDFAATAAAAPVDDINTKLMLLEIASVLLPCAEVSSAEAAFQGSGWVDLCLAFLSPPNAASSPSSTTPEAVMYRNIAAMLGCRLVTGRVCAQGASLEFVSKVAPSLFSLSLGAFSWLSNEGPLHALIQSVQNQLDRMPSLASSKDAQAFSEAPVLCATVDWGKFSEFTVLKLRIQGSPCCVVCGVTEGKLQVCGQCKRRGVFYCSRNCQSKDWARHKTVCAKKKE